MNVPSDNSGDLEASVRQQLRDVLGANEGDALSADLDFGAIGMNSVDFLEFVLGIETTFAVDVPDEALIDPKMRTIAAWVDFLSSDKQ